MESAGASYPNPLGLFPQNGWFSGFASATFALGAVIGVLVVVSAFARRRGAGAERREQMAWLGYIGLMSAVWLALLLIAGALNVANGWIGTTLWVLLVLTPVVGIPVACTTAVLKYRLYDIDRIISRTLAYAIVTGLLLGLYAGLVLLATRVLPLHTPVAVAGSTLAAAALFSPLRRRVQQVVDHRFNRARYDLTGIVHRALEPTHVSVWLRPPG